MKFLLIGILFAWGGNCLLADSLVCTAGGGPNIVPCSTSPLSIMAQFPTLAISGNTISISPMLNFGVPSTTLPQLNVSVSGTIDDTLALPSSPTGDVLKVNVGYGYDINDAQANASFSFQIGPGNASFPEINLNPIDQPPAYCPPGGTNDCVLNSTLPTSAFSFVAIQGSATLIANANSPADGGVSSGGIFQFSRFKADGVTPDPFTPTPEPASFPLAAGGLALGAGWMFKRRSGLRG